MNVSRRLLVLAAFVALPALALAAAQLGAAGGDSAAKADRAAVERAVRDYLEAFYDAKPELIERGVHPRLVKYGYGRNPDTGEWRGTGMDFEQAKVLAARFNADGSRVPESAPRAIEVFDVLDRTAAAKLTATWGIDYFHLVKEEGEWKILQVLWQSAPSKQG